MTSNGNDTPNQTAQTEIERLKTDRAKLVRALETIREVRYGLDCDDTPEQQIEYWARLACAYRQIAAGALKEIS